MPAAPTGAALWLGLAGWIALSFLAAATGLITDPSSYQSLRQPSWAPPSWVFGPVWTLLYVMMGTAAWFVWKEGGFSAQGIALGLFLAQLALNALWTPLFFGANLRGWAFLDIVVLWTLIVATTVAFWRVRPLAGLLFVPYLAWVSFAAVLNVTVWRMNVPGASG